MRLLNLRLIFRTLNYILLLETGAFLICIPVSVLYKEPKGPFLWSAAISFIISTILLIGSGNTLNRKFSNRDGYMIVTTGWILFSLLGSLPYLISGEIHSVADAVFESTSGFSTTGSSILTDVEALSFSMLFWRSLTHWIGGIGIIVLVIIILPSLNINGYQLFTLESSLREKMLPKTKAIGFRVLFIYIGLTAAEVVFLYAGDMNLFDSVCHSFGTMATGGFSTKNSSLKDFPAYIQYVIMIFMFLAGISQVVYYYLLKLNFSKIRNNEELWFYVMAVLLAGSMASFIILSRSALTPESAFREGFFQVISVMTCTGFASADYLLWPVPGVMLIFMLMFAGGCTGSTSGGIKMARHLVSLKMIKAAFVKLTHPHAFPSVKFSGKTISERTGVSIVSFVILYLFIFLIGSIIMTVTGLDVVTASSSVATCMAGIGPGLGSVGPMSNYAAIPDVSKIILSLVMIIGRLEIITVIIIFTKGYWRI